MRKFIHAKLRTFIRSEKINKLSQFHQSDTTLITLIFRTKGIKIIVPFEHPEGTWELRKHLRHSGTQIIWALQGLKHSSTWGTQALERHLGTQVLEELLFSKLPKDISWYYTTLLSKCVGSITKSFPPISFVSRRHKWRKLGRTIDFPARRLYFPLIYLATGNFLVTSPVSM